MALAFLAAYALPIAVPTIPEWTAQACETVIWVAWALFAIDYVTRLSLSDRRWSFVKSNPLDLAVVLLPLLRPLRLVRLLALVSILHRTGSRELRGRVALYTAGGATLLITVGALAITDAERYEPGANITTLGDGFWWALTTMTTVGYGDRFPVTPVGRLVAAALMVSGIALLGVVTATIASWLVERVSENAEVEEAATRAQVERLTAEVAALRALLDPAQPAPTDDGATERTSDSGTSPTGSDNAGATGRSPGITTGPAGS